MKPLMFLFVHMRKYAWPLALTVTSMFLLVGLQLVIPWIIKTMIRAVTDGEAEQFSQALVTRLALLAFAVYLARAILQFLRSYMAHIAGWGVVADARKVIYEHMQRLSLRFYEDKQTGQLMSRLVNDSDKFELLIAHAVPDLLVNVLTLIGVTALLFSLNWQLTLFSMAPIPLILLALHTYARFVRPAFLQRQKDLGELNAVLNDNLSGIREIKTFTREQHEAQRVHSQIDHYRNSLLHALKMMAIFQPFIGAGHHCDHLFWRPVDPPAKPGCGRPGGLFPLSGPFLPAAAPPERCLGEDSRSIGQRRPSDRVAG
jgi:ATP-binding cassette subfamily B protein/subfamily B ATP-binding cassette protein MsbA